MLKNNFNFKFIAIIGLLFFAIFTSARAQDSSGILSPEEDLWLKSRNNTIVVYPEKGFPPFSYQSTAGTPQGLSIDYIELIAEKIGVKIQYLPARIKSQILEDVKTGKGDVLTSVADTQDREEYLYFSDNYITISTVIVVRKDDLKSKSLTLSDLVGKKVAVGDGYAVGEFIRKNYPRIIIDSVTDDEVGLQQVVLGEVDAAVMDIASLSFYMSKQVLNSVKVVGSAGYDYKLAFAVPKDKQILQSILDKGLTQISQTDRQILSDKWIIVPGEEKESTVFDQSFHQILTPNNIYIFLISCLVIIIFFLIYRRHSHSHLEHKLKDITELKTDLSDLEQANQLLSKELEHVHEEEQKIKEKLQNLNP